MTGRRVAGKAEGIGACDVACEVFIESFECWVGEDAGFPVFACGVEESTVDELGGVVVTLSDANGADDVAVFSVGEVEAADVAGDSLDDCVGSEFCHWFILVFYGAASRNPVMGADR